MHLCILICYTIVPEEAANKVSVPGCCNPTVAPASSVRHRLTPPRHNASGSAA